MKLQFVIIFVGLLTTYHCATVDTVTDSVIKLLFSYFPKAKVKPLVTRLTSFVCDFNETDVTLIERDLAKHAILNGTLAQLNKTQTDLQNVTLILGQNEYQSQIGIFLDKVFEPFLYKLPDVAENSTDSKICKTNIINEIESSLTTNASAAALKRGLASFKSKQICIAMFPILFDYLPFQTHNITVTHCTTLIV